jgi:hypothetical protein
MRYSVTAAYTCLVRIYCPAADVRCFFRGRYRVTGLHAAILLFYQHCKGYMFGSNCGLVLGYHE